MTLEVYEEIEETVYSSATSEPGTKKRAVEQRLRYTRVACSDFPVADLVQHGGLADCSTRSSASNVHLAVNGVDDKNNLEKESSSIKMKESAVFFDSAGAGSGSSTSKAAGLEVEVVFSMSPDGALGFSVVEASSPSSSSASKVSASSPASSRTNLVLYGYLALMVIIYLTVKMIIGSESLDSHTQTITPATNFGVDLAKVAISMGKEEGEEEEF